MLDVGRNRPFKSNTHYHLTLPPYPLTDPCLPLTPTISHIFLHTFLDEEAGNPDCRYHSYTHQAIDSSNLWWSRPCRGIFLPIISSCKTKWSARSFSRGINCWVYVERWSTKVFSPWLWEQGSLHSNLRCTVDPLAFLPTPRVQKWALQGPVLHR
jgi:hypothetical protein